MNPGSPFVPTSGDANLQSAVTVLQNLVQAVNNLTLTVKTQFSVNSVYTVATLPTVAAPARAFVSDSTVAGSGNFGAAVVGGGAHYVPVYWDNVSWKIG